MMIVSKKMIAAPVASSNRSEKRHERSPLSNLNPKYSPATTDTNAQPQRAIPATAKAIFKTNFMLIGR